MPSDDTLDPIIPEVPEIQPKKSDSAAKLEEALAAAQTELKAAQEEKLRMYAEMENMRRRTRREIEDAHKFALDSFVKALIPVVDSLEQGLSLKGQGEAHAHALHEGMELTLKMLLDVLKKHSVEVVEPLNQSFDPALHEAMAMQPTDEVAPNTVITVIQKGYTLHGRLLRPARVLVARALEK